MTIGDRIKHRREELGMTQADLAEALGYKSKSSINKIELGKQELTQKKIKLVAEALSTSVAYVMGWEETHADLHAAGLTAQDVADELGLPSAQLEALIGCPSPEIIEKLSRVAHLLTDEATRKKLGITDREWQLILNYRAASDKDRAVVDTVLGLIER